MGFIIDTKRMEFSVPQRKIHALTQLLTAASLTGKQSAKQVARITGHLISMSLAIGPTSRLFTRQMYRYISLQPNWYASSILPMECVNEISFWLNNLEKSNGFSIKLEDTATKILYTDASNTGYGGYLVQQEGNLVARGRFKEEERQRSLTHRELLAVVETMTAFIDKLRGENVTIYTDNSNVAVIVKNGSTKPDLQELAIQIHNFSASENEAVRAHWIPRELNTIADTISKIKDSDNWSIDAETFSHIQERFGTFTVDRFADHQNAKVPYFNSKYFCPNTALVDAFAANWSQDFNQ